MPFTLTSAKPDVRSAVENASSALALLSGRLLIRLILPFTLGSTKMVWPVALARTLATDSISALENDKVTLPVSGTVGTTGLKPALFCAIRCDDGLTDWFAFCAAFWAYTAGINTLSPSTHKASARTSQCRKAPCPLHGVLHSDFTLLCIFSSNALRKLAN